MPNRIVQLEIHTIGGGQLAMNVIHLRGDTTETDNFKVAKNIVEAFDETTGSSVINASNWINPFSDQIFISSAVARVVDVAGQPKFPKLYADTDYVGQTAAPIYSQQLACNLKLVTASGPDYTGRIFLPGIPNDAIDKNRWTSAWETAMGTFIGWLTTGMETVDGTFDLCVFKRSNRTAELVTNTVLTPNPGTIRRRLSPV